MSIGENIKKHRKNKGLTQLQLAELSNISRSYLGDLEKDRYNPSLDTLNALAKALNIDTSNLLPSTRTESPSPALITEKDERDIAKDVDSIMGKIKSGEDGPLYYNGEEMDPDDLELFKDAIELALKRIKVENKEKYTPKKFRK